MLYNYKKLDSWIEDCEKELEFIREKIDALYCVGTSKLSDMPHSTGTSDNTLNAVDGIIKLKEVYNERSKVIARELKEYYKQKELVEWIFPQLRPLHQDILELRYFKNMIWQDICEELNLERITLGKANTELYKIINQLLKEKAEN
jgi:phage terminase large subunit